jgi:glycosyltransferase involved in cell wall biosynthesis
LEKLANQTYPSHLYEVIVVDNASEDGDEVEEVVARFDRTFASYESFPSSFAARNRGISLAKGDIIAFTDADCIPEEDWIEKGVKILLATSNCGLVGGKVEVFFNDRHRVTPVELYENITAFPQQELIEKYNYAATANVFTFKSVIDRVGNFDSNLKSSGDIEWGQRVAKFGYKQVYADDVCVAHPARSSFSQLIKRTVRLAGGIYDLHDKQNHSLFDRDRLKICLKSLTEQTYSNDFYEIIVVDNGSEAEQNIVGVVNLFKGVVATYESFPSSYAARNKGIYLAKEEVIAFTDADCIPEEDWIEKGVKNLLATPNCGLVVGKIEIFFKTHDRATPVELYESIEAFPQQEFVEKYRGGATANLFTYKSVIDRVGSFKTHLKSGGDIEWSQRVNAFGDRVIYAEEVCVKHPARYSYEQIYKQTIRISGGVYDRYLEDKITFKDINLTFLRLIIDDILLTFKRIINIFRIERIKGIKQKIATSYVAVFVGFFSCWEKFRLRLGKNSSRA